MGEGTPARIDRAALERIIQRAAELQTADRDIGEELTPEQVLALGREVGIPGPLPAAGAARGAHPARRGARPRVRGSGSRGRRRWWPSARCRDPPAVEAALARVDGGEGAASASSGSSRAGSPGSRSAGWPAALRRSTAAFSRGSAAMMLARAERSPPPSCRSRPAGATWC